MTEANLLPSYIPTSLTAFIKLGKVCIQFQEKAAIHCILLHLVQHTLVTVQQGMYALVVKELDTAFISYRVQRGLYTILGKNSYTLIRLGKHTL